jgi:Mlc titration factor MtfA (ptsG expression regulator)
MYGALNEAEFFAVATESYFEKPRLMKQLTPDLYTELQEFYGGDPAAEASILSEGATPNESAPPSSPPDNRD